MKNRAFVGTVIAVLMLNIAGLAGVDNKRAAAKKRPATRLVSLLPASDGVAVFDSRRFLTDALPKVLASNQPMLGEITAKISEMEARTGIDLRKFDQVAVGIGTRAVSPTEVDFEVVAIAGGDINAGALLAVAKLASHGTYREEKIGDRTVYIFTPKDVVQQNTVTINNSKLAHVVDKALASLSKEIAVTALNKNTLVMGPLERVKETLEARTHIASELTGLLSVKETSVLSFAFRSPPAVAKLLPVDQDAFGSTVESIKFLSGSLDVAATGTSLQVMARTPTPEKAAELKDMLVVLKGLGKFALGNSKRPNQAVYSRVLGNVKVDSRGSDVTFDVLVPQSDIDVLVSGIK